MSPLKMSTTNILITNTKDKYMLILNTFSHKIYDPPPPQQLSDITVKHKKIKNLTRNNKKSKQEN